MTYQGRDDADDDLDDAAVIQLSRREPEQFTRLFRRHAPHIQRYVARRLGPDAADDIVAETFLLAFRQRDRYDQSRPDARPWLYGIATNLIGRQRRAEVRLYRALARTGADPVAEPFTDGSTTGSARARLPGGWRRRWPGSPQSTATRCCWWCGATCRTTRPRRRSVCRSARCAPG